MVWEKNPGTYVSRLAWMSRLVMVGLRGLVPPYKYLRLPARLDVAVGYGGTSRTCPTLQILVPPYLIQSLLRLPQ